MFNCLPTELQILSGCIITETESSLAGYGFGLLRWDGKLENGGLPEYSHLPQK